MVMPGTPSPAGPSMMTGAPMGPSTLGSPQMRIRNIANKVKQPAQVQGVPGSPLPPGMMPGAIAGPGGPGAPAAPAPPAPPLPQMVAQAAANMLFDNRDLIDRFVDKVLRKV